MIANPFYIKNEEVGTVMNMSYQDTNKNYKHVFLLVSKDNNEYDEDLICKIFDKEIPQEYANELFSNFVLMKSPISLMYNFNMKKRSNLVSGDFLKEYFPNNVYDIDEIVVPMYELTESSSSMLIELNKTTTTRENIKNTISLVTYYKNNSHIFDNKICQMIMDMDQTKFWQNPINCELNLTKIFTNRFMSYNCVKIDKINVFEENIKDEEFENITEMILEFNNKLKEHNYLHMNENEQNQQKENNYVTVKSVLDDATKRTFYTSNDQNTEINYSKDEIADLFDYVKDNEKFRYYLMNTLLVSKEYCHLVLNNKRVLIGNADLFEKYKPLYIYLIGYAWTTLYVEEQLVYTKTTKSNRFAFDIETANNLPVFPFSFENMFLNPYFSMLVDKQKINCKENCISVNSLKDYKKYYGVATKEDAMKRFNIFASGKEDQNIFENLDGKIFSFSGSVIPACIQRYAPLIDLCTKDTMTNEEKYNMHFKNYYNTSDIDVMVGTNNTYDFLHNVNVFIDNTIKNIKKYDNLIERSDIEIIPNKKTCVVITKYFEGYCLPKLNEQFQTSFTAEQFSNSEFGNKLKEYIYPIYQSIKQSQIEKWNSLKEQYGISENNDIFDTYHKSSLITELDFKKGTYAIAKNKYSIKDTDVCYFVNDIVDENNRVSDENNFLVFKVSESIKFKIKSKKLQRDMEIFKVSEYDPFNTVARFHLPCVRAYMQNDNFYLLPSFITATMTSINIDYKYFCGSHDPIAILNKYRMRGYGTILNEKEKRGFYNYNKKIKGMFKVNSKDELFGPMDLNNKIYKPDNTIAYNESKHVYFTTNKDVLDLYELTHNISKLPVNIMNFSSISDKGNVNIYQNWISSAYYNF